MNENEIDYSILPEHMQHGAKLYIEHGIISGSFLTAVMENDLVYAFGAADETNRFAMFDWARFLYNEAPVNCWGSRENVEKWRALGGLRGIMDAGMTETHDGDEH